MSSVTSTSSTSTSSTSTVTNGRYWGLASGLDVDSIVTGLVSDQQSKIDKADQAQQTLEWKQEAYRGIITELNTFESAYLKLGASSTMASTNMYTSYSTVSTTTSGNSVLTATANSDASGVAQTVDITQSAAASSLIGSSINGGGITGTKTWADALSSLYSAVQSGGAQSLNLTVDDVTKTITFDSSEINDTTSASDFQHIINSKLSAAFGSVDGNAKVQTTSDIEGSFGLTTTAGYNIKVTVSSLSSSGTLTSLGIKGGTSNHLSANGNLGAFLASKGVTPDNDTTYTPDQDEYYNFKIDVNGKTVTLNTKTMSVSDALAAVNSAGAGVKAVYNSNSDAVTLTATQSGSTGGFNINDTTGFFKALMTSGPVTDETYQETSTGGQDAIFSITSGGITTNYTRASNDFTISGVTYSINSPVSSAKHSVANLTFTQNTDALKTGLQNFISAYNTLISDIHKQINTAPDSNYPPLTDAQKAAMTTTQVDNWNAKANSGMLFNDSTLQGICDTMRSVLYQSVPTSDGGKISLFDLGITTSDTSTDYGKLEIKAGDQTKFNNALATSASKIKELFTNSSDILLDISSTADKTPMANGKTPQQNRILQEGLVNRLDDIIQSATGMVGSAFGSLVLIAGTTDLNTYNNSIFKEITEGNDNISNLKTQLKDKKNRLYAQFTRLETYMEQANSQSSIISSLSGS